MQSYILDTKRKPLMVKLGVEVKRPCRVQVIVLNPNKRNTVYYDRWKDVQNTQDFDIKLPQNAEKSRLIIQCVKGSGSDDNVRITKIEKASLPTHAPCLNGNGWNGVKTKEFIKFAQEFCENCGTYGFGSYWSDSRTFRIDYYPVIMQKGKALTTPARIHNGTGLIEISKQAFDVITVPCRMAILLHEYSHFNLNEVQDDEIEADLNGLKIYLGLGYPVIEAHKGFLDVFVKHPSNQNRERYEYLKNFIDNFETEKFRICLP